MAQLFRKDVIEEDDQNLVISIEDLDASIDEDLTEEEKHEEKILELQLTMATTSINHEYARLEYEEAKDYEKREELLYFMAECRSKYLKARTDLSEVNPLILEQFEKDLILQKQTTITHYNA